MCYNKTIRSESREAGNKNAMDAGGVLFFRVARTRGGGGGKHDAEVAVVTL